MYPITEANIHYGTVNISYGRILERPIKSRRWTVYFISFMGISVCVRDSSEFQMFPAILKYDDKFLTSAVKLSPKIKSIVGNRKNTYIINHLK